MNTRTVSIVALLLLGCSASAQSDARILAAIGAVESGGDRLAVGDRGQSLGQYQVQRAGWTEANARLASEGRPTYSRRDWRSPVAQDMIAAALLRVIRGRLTAQGIPNPSPAQLALCWTMGVTGAKAVGFDPSLAPAPKQSYAQRVANLVGR